MNSDAVEMRHLEIGDDEVGRRGSEPFERDHRIVERAHRDAGLDESASRAKMCRFVARSSNIATSDITPPARQPRSCRQNRSRRGETASGLWRANFSFPFLLLGNNVTQRLGHLSLTLSLSLSETGSADTGAEGIDKIGVDLLQSQRNATDEHGVGPERRARDFQPRRKLLER